ncbi:MAG: hypothetical protein OEZ58_13565 [Gammaproteobacteria bacterium]|nr:hypothetical protein [Gammaproteobacteria bacterium]MDH5730016.1 hypothetical protein [Gammaproteobacteria bacterium]
MELQPLPNIDAYYTNSQGEAFMVIGRGTRGIIIEYSDGRVELVSMERWRKMTVNILSKAFH